ncbi:NAD kinase [Niabella ginsenosidivorans]|uniref:NAD kinase n=1 Tax=Niabella ginsenosidivorans TaxID=1176587 RepID=A0A1A9I841_9BACT|nr:NAD kinase [Niabella ginsenosidivorans]ANH82832.1 NAD kinase [Niabella ginsenosidivorans]
MTIAVYSRGIDQLKLEDVKTFFNEVQYYDLQIIVFKPFFDEIKEHIPLAEDTGVFLETADLSKEVECIISLGGDGTLLDTVALISDKPIAIMGINFGRLGFLASIGSDNLKLAIRSLAFRTYVTEQRTLVHLDADIPMFGDKPFGLNEFAIHKRDTASMIKVHTFINGEFLNVYWADGLVVSTPTGSTGYSLSCGGPIVFPDSGNFVITPVAPHHLNTRSLVVNDNSIISFEIESRADDIICALDSRKEIVTKNVSLAVRKERFTISLIRLGENNFLHTLQTKLIWGLDRRNTPA